MIFSSEYLELEITDTIFSLLSSF
uniref:Uncharacterized protein n=1 Tax=Rhizophora mucronata TaxID=61149 RepID=A0A2P2P962_RHIMU